jgi:hypothetical protein
MGEESFHADGQTRKANSLFSQLCKSALKPLVKVQREIIFTCISLCCKVLASNNALFKPQTHQELRVAFHGLLIILITTLFVFVIQ